MLDRLLIAGGGRVLSRLRPMVLVSGLTAFHIRWTMCSVWSVLWNAWSGHGLHRIILWSLCCPPSRMLLLEGTGGEYECDFDWVGRGRGAIRSGCDKRTMLTRWWRRYAKDFAAFFSS